MLAHLRTLSLRPGRSHLLCRPAYASRQLSFTPTRLAEAAIEEAEANEEQDDVEQDDPEDGQQSGSNYESWLAKTGIAFKGHDIPRNWLGGNRPFPLNPTFKPPTPVSDGLRSVVYDEFMSNPKTNSVRALSQRYGLSIKRVDAILRLKGLEAKMKKGKPLQSGYLKGMEKILGVTLDNRTRHYHSTGMEQLGEEATHADYQDEIDGNNEARYRYQRMFWEPVVEGQKPFIADNLETARSQTQELKQAAEDAKSDAKLLGRPIDSPPHRTTVRVVKRPGRSTLKFVDVGGKFLDVRDRVRRMKEGEHSSRQAR
ncbi:hypothetical protein EIP91_007283 [Steccherinum ochraceum]|uniref:37S ribosomal protein S35, mitochondrial n=1 Tax=Steccherinum ochraceum TaxID=92696 RepID=A0A4R0RA31_9APHY|nr:hypothetical protein EIP91_007283 [Steccherinum ochraceum]